MYMHRRTNAMGVHPKIKVDGLFQCLFSLESIKLH